MKTNMTQIILTALAILFAMALALTVALICLSYAGGAETRESNSESNAPVDRPATDASDMGTLLPSDTTLPPEVIEPPIEDLGNGLSFASNGNGTCTVTGIGKCDDACIVIPEYSPADERVTAIAPRAFYACATATAIQIPKSVTSIGALAFAACPNLVYLSVDAANTDYCDIDGILYTADGRALITYPAMRAGAEITISAVTVEIMEMAFYNCSYLSRIYYTGSAEQWESIAIAPKNYSLTAAAKSFYGGKG